ncbi:MAG: glycosyltransferase family 4 protein [Thermoleophilia bacterium]|nr:glycosyltransferase family 4 protein [Thermoleophilia bacterium]
MRAVEEAERRAISGTAAATLVVTSGAGSMDLYAQRLAAHLDVPTITTDVHEHLSRAFGAPLFSRRSLRCVRADVRFVRALRAIDGPVHLPNHHLARYARAARGPYVVTVHDLIRYFDWRGNLPLIHRPGPHERLGLRLDYRGIRRADHVIAVSQTTKRDLVRHLGVPEERITVVYEGVDHELFRPVVTRPLDEPYVLFVGSEQPRKNLPRLLRAFAAVKRDRRLADLKLVKVGRASGGERGFRRRTLAAVRELALERDVVFTGLVPDEDLPAWYSAAECLALPSFYEGFGFPPLEAMACGCPVVVSSAGALPEIAGDAALVVDPHDPAALADALRQVLLDPELRRELARRGRQRAAHFSWQRAAEQTIAVYERLY